MQHTNEQTRPIWVRPKEAARLSGLGLTRVYELLNDGTLVTRKCGGARLISTSSIEALGAAPPKPDDRPAA